MDEKGKEQRAEDFMQMAQLEMEAGMAADKIKEKMNELIQEYNLRPLVVLSILARLSAAFIHVMQKQEFPAEKDKIEDCYQMMLETYLAHQDLLDVQMEIQRMKDKEVN